MQCNAIQYNAIEICIGNHTVSSSIWNNRPFTTNDHMVQNPPSLRAGSLVWVGDKEPAHLFG